MLTWLLSEWLGWRGVSQGGVDKQNVFCYNLNFLRSRAQLHVQRLEPLLPPFEGKQGVFFSAKGTYSHKFLRCKPLVRSGGMVPPRNHEILHCNGFSKWQFRHFHIIFVVFCKVFIIITNVFGLFFAVVNPSFQNQTGRFVSLLLHHGHFEKSWIIYCKLNVHKV